MSHELAEQISQLKKQKWVDLQGLITCATTHLRTAKPYALSNLTCISISLLGRGSYNTVYKLVFTDSIQIAASVSNHDKEDFKPQAKRSEIETMNFVRKSGLYPDIPVPKVYAWDTTFTNPARAPYVLMDVVHGTTLHNLKDSSGLHGLDTLSRTQQLSVVKSLANVQASLSRVVPFNEIGSVTANAEGKHTIGPLMTLTQQCLGGPYKSEGELWHARLEHELLHALQEWSNIETDELSQSLSEPSCTPQTFAELFQLLSSLIPHFGSPPIPYLPLVLHHPDLALRNIFFDTASLSSNDPKITGVIDWGGAQILPLMLTAQFPDDLKSTGDDPCERPGYVDESWRSVPCDWTSFGDISQWPQASCGSHGPIDFTPRAAAMVRRFYLRTYFSACYAKQMCAVHGDTDLAHATLFADAPYYLKFHETVCNGWTSWVEHSSWIRETYWRIRIAGQTHPGALIIGPNVYRESVETLVCDLGVFEGSQHVGNGEE